MGRFQAKRKRTYARDNENLSVLYHCILCPSFLIPLLSYETLESCRKPSQLIRTKRPSVSTWGSAFRLVFLKYTRILVTVFHQKLFNHSRISALTESKVTELFQEIFHLLALLLSCHLILNERLAFRSNCLHHLGSSLVSRVTMATGRKPIQCWKRMAKGNGSYIDQRCWNCISREVERHSLIWTKQAGQGMGLWGLKSLKIFNKEYFYLESWGRYLFIFLDRNTFLVA